MAVKEPEDDVALAPATAPLLERANAAWLEPVRARLGVLQAQGRMPHGLLLTGVPGAGQAEIAAWLAAHLLCRADSGRPCGRCPDCSLFRAGSHPDFRWIGVLPDKKDIGIEQLRALSESLSMRSYRGGAKVSVIAPADAMSTKAHNALLKTLEEPASETYLVLAASRVERIPKTILSRCMRIAMPLPQAGDALAWLSRQGAAADGTCTACSRGGRALPRPRVPPGRSRDAGSRDAGSNRRGGRGPPRSRRVCRALRPKCPGRTARLARKLADAQLEGRSPG